MLTKSPLVRRLIAGLYLCSCFAWLPTEAEARTGHQRRHQRRTIRRVIRRVTAVDQSQHQHLNLPASIVEHFSNLS